MGRTDRLGAGFVALSVSCSSPTFCLAVGKDARTAQGVAMVARSGSWRRVALDAPGTTLAAVSCTSASFCVTVGKEASGDRAVALVYDGHAFGAPTALDVSGGLSAVSCGTAHFCAAVGTNPGASRSGGPIGDSRPGAALTFDGRTWSAPVATPVVGLVSVSCTPQRRCLAVGGNGSSSDTIVYDGHTWGHDGTVDVVGLLAAVSCAPSRFCALVSGGGLTFTATGTWWDGGGRVWSDRLEPPAGIPLPEFAAVSCPGAALCIAVDDSARAFAYRTSPGGIAWSAPVQVTGLRSLVSVSCPVVPSGDPSCVAVGPLRSGGGSGAVVLRPRA